MEAPSRLTKVALAQYRYAIRARDDFIKYSVDDTNPLVWYVLLSNITGDEGEFIGGEYLVKIQLPDGFPVEPPKFYFLTANGVYAVNNVVCIHIGHYHKQNYIGTLGVSGFCKQLVSGMIGWRTLGNGISLLSTSVDEKKVLARQSRDANIANHAQILQKIEAGYAEYSAKW